MLQVLECFKMGCWTTIKSFHVKIILLDKQELIQEVQGRTTGQDLLDFIYKYLNLLETAYFGLRYQDNSNQTHWLDPNKRVSQQIKGISPITLYLGVKFYAADPCKLVEEITRYQFFLQVKLDILQGRLPVPFDLSIDLAALALQSELGDYDVSRHSQGYVSEFRFLASQTEELELRIEEAHARLVGLIPAQAENRYLEKVKWLDMYGVDLHPVIGEDNIEYFLGLTPSGIIVLENRKKVGNYFWPRISKIYFKGKYFMLRVRNKNNDEKEYGFETPSRQACKHLWKCCVEHHAFFRLVQVNPTANSSSLFGLGSRLRSSSRSEKEVKQDLSEVRNRQPPNFTRVPSQRYSRRSRSEDTVDKRRGGTLERKEASHLDITRQLSNNNLYDSYSRANSLPRPTMQSLPPEMLDSSLLAGTEAAGDLSLRSLQYLESRGLFGSKTGHQSRKGGDLEPDTSYRKSRSRRGGSDDESEASGVSLASGRHRDRHRDRDSGSESESGRSSARKHHRRRKRSGSYKLVETDQQWRDVQSRQGRGTGAVSEATVRKSGYLNSGAETESELVNTLRRNKRRQRSRSRSPSEARAKLPTELVKHFEFGLVDPQHSQDPLDIPYINVETQKPIKMRYSSGRRSRNNSGNSARRKINMEDTQRHFDDTSAHRDSQRHNNYDDTSTVHSNYSSHPPFSGPHSAGWQAARLSSQGYYQNQAQVSTVSSLQQSISNISNISLDHSAGPDPVPPAPPVPSMHPHTSLPPHMTSYQPQHSYKVSSILPVPPVSSSSTTSASSSPRQIPSSLPSTGLSSLPLSSYSPVYNNNNMNMHSSPSTRHFRQSGHQSQRSNGPPPLAPHKGMSGPASLQSGVRHNGMSSMVSTPPPRPHPTRHWPPNSQNPEHNLVNKLPSALPKRLLTNQYEPSGDEMSTEL